MSSEHCLQSVWGGGSSTPPTRWRRHSSRKQALKLDLQQTPRASTKGDLQGQCGHPTSAAGMAIQAGAQTYAANTAAVMSVLKTQRQLPKALKPCESCGETCTALPVMLEGFGAAPSSSHRPVPSISARAVHRATAGDPLPRELGTLSIGQQQTHPPELVLRKSALQIPNRGEEGPEQSASGRACRRQNWRL